jgi:hypothetical protein
MTARLAGTLTPTSDLGRERVRVALIALVRDIAMKMATDNCPWFIDDRAGTVRDNAGALIAYIDPTALHLVQQLQALGVA